MGIKAFHAEKPDPEWELPASAAGLSMSSEKAAREFNSRAEEEFIDKTPGYFPTDGNHSALVQYLAAQDVGIATLECWSAAFKRLSNLGLLEERLQAEPHTVPVEEPQPPAEPELVNGWDVETGQPRQYSQREIYRMDAETYRHAFKLYGDSRPSMRRSIYQ